jgi:hypothetical protein
MWQHIVAIGKIVQEQTTSFWQSASVATSVLAGFNKSMGEVLLRDYQGFSPFWAVLPITLLVAVALYRKVMALEEQVRPRVELIFDSTDARYNRVEDAVNGRGVRTFRVGVKNIGNAMLNACSIRLDNFEDVLGWTHPRVPYGLERRDGKGPFPLRPDEFKLANVVALDERQADSKIRVFFFEGDHVPMERKEYRITIGAYPEIGRATIRHFRLFVANGSLMMVPLDNEQLTARSPSGARIGNGTGR